MISPNQHISSDKPYQYYDGFRPYLFDVIFDHICEKVAEWEPSGVPEGVNSIVFNNMDDILKITNNIYYIHAVIDEEVEE